MKQVHGDSRRHPRLGEGWDGEYPVRDLFCRHSGWFFGRAMSER